MKKTIIAMCAFMSLSAFAQEIYPPIVSQEIQTQKHYFETEQKSAVEVLDDKNLVIQNNEKQVVKEDNKEIKEVSETQENVVKAPAKGLNFKVFKIQNNGKVKMFYDMQMKFENKEEKILLSEIDSKPTVTENDEIYNEVLKTTAKLYFIEGYPFVELKETFVSSKVVPEEMIEVKKQSAYENKRGVSENSKFEFGSYIFDIEFLK